MTGSDGYIGSILGSELIRDGHDVIGLDTGFYRSGWLYCDQSNIDRIPESINMDLRQVSKQLLEGIDAVVHMAELSNDPLGENNPAVTFDINHKGSVNLARLAREAGVKRFIYTSSCSVYGIGDGGYMNESSAVNPQTAYAECKVRVERDVAKLADDGFAPVFLRNATAYGASPRMRFDIVLNNLTGIAWVSKTIAMTSDGTPWRPLVHVNDICNAIKQCLVAPRQSIFNEVFNVGSTSENYRIHEIASIVGNVIPECEVSMGENGGDSRSYRVAFEKICSHLPGFRCRWSAEEGAHQLRGVFDRISLSSATFEASAFTRLKQLQFLVDSGQLDEDLYWVDV